MPVAYHQGIYALTVRAIADAHKAAVTIALDVIAACWPRLSEEPVQRFRSCLSAPIFEAGPIGAPLPALGSIYAVEANPLTVNIDRVAVDDAGAPDDRFRRNCRSREEQRRNGDAEAHLDGFEGFEGSLSGHSAKITGGFEGFEGSRLGDLSSFCL